MISVEDLSQTTPPARASTPAAGIVISRGHRVYLRTLTVRDLDLLTEWVDDPFIERMVGSLLMEGYAFLETIVTDHRALRRGFGIEAAQLIAYYGVDVLGLRRIEAKAYEYNGFVQEGVLREAGWDGERFCNVLVFGILRDDLTTPPEGRAPSGGRGVERARRCRL